MDAVRVRHVDGKTEAECRRIARDMERSRDAYALLGLNLATVGWWANAVSQPRKRV